MSTSDREIDGLQMGRLIGRGGSAMVYEANDPRHGRQVAVKVLEVPGLEGRRRRAFRRELQAMGRLGDHPHVVDVFDSGFTVDGSPYLVMPLIEGGTVAQRIRDGEPFGVEEVLDFGVKIGSALETAHRRGILHCDIKPSNLFLGAFSTPMLGDLGISSVSEAGLTTTSQLSLTIMYAAPEIIENEPHSVRSDIYSLGASLFAITDMGPPFTGGTTAALIRNILSSEEPPVLRRSVPAGLALVIADMMARNPGDRPGSAIAAVERFQDLQRILGYSVTEAAIDDVEAPASQLDPATGVTPNAHDDTRSRSVGVIGSSSGGSRRWLVGAAAALLLIVGVFGAWALRNRNSGDGDAARANASALIDDKSSSSNVDGSSTEPAVEPPVAVEPVATEARGEREDQVESPTTAVVTPTEAASPSPEQPDAQQSPETQQSPEPLPAPTEPAASTTPEPLPSPTDTAEQAGPTARVAGSVVRADGTAADSIEVDLFTQLGDGERGDFIEGAVTNLAGSFVFDVPTPACYVLTYVAPEGFIVAGGDAFLNAPLCVEDAATVTAGARIEQQRVADAELTGRVIRTDTFAGVAEAQVDVFIADGDGTRGAFVGTVYTGADGTYRYALATGCYIVTFVAPEGSTLVGGNEFLNVAAGCVASGESATVSAQLE